MHNRDDAVAWGIASHGEPRWPALLEIDAAFTALDRQATRLGALLERLLEASRSRHPAVEQGPIDVGDAVADALEMAPAPADVTVTVLTSAPALVVFADRAGLARVIVNLLTNAYRYGGSNIVIDARSPLAGGGVIEVRDDGPGVPIDLAPTMFESFTRGGDEGGRGQSQPGSAGLGLALSSEIVASFSGRLDYHPIKPHGACLTVTLPRLPPGSDPPPTTEFATEGSTAGTSQRRP